MTTEQSGHVGPLAYHVLEMCETGDLKASSGLSQEKTLTVLDQLMEGTKHMHSQNWAHMDLKLENIMKSSMTDKYVLIDFGLSLPFQNNQKYNEPHGTSGRLAPELTNADSTSYDPKFVDVYCFGLLIFEMLTGCSISEIPEEANSMSYGTYCFSYSQMQEDPVNFWAAVKAYRPYTKISLDMRTLMENLMSIEPRLRGSIHDAHEKV